MTFKRSPQESTRSAMSLSTAMNVSSQTVMNGLAGVEPHDPVLYADHLNWMLDLVTCTAVLFLRKLGVPNPRQAADDVRQDWGLSMMSGGFQSYLQQAHGRPFAPFAFRALWRKCADYAGGKSRPRTCDYHCDYEDPQRSPALEAEYREILLIVAEEVNRLPATQREALRLTVWDGLTAEEAAAELGTTETAVHSRAYRGRQKLSQRLQDRDVWPLEE